MTDKKRFKLPNKLKRKKAGEDDAAKNEAIPRITNETVTQHREDVIKSAKKYKYPLRQSRHKIVVITSILLTVLLIGFFTFTMLSLYRYQSTSAFMYQVTKIIPFPVAKVGNTFVSYEDYLFELRHYIHYFENQQDVDFDSEQGKAQLAEQRKKSLDKVVKDAYVAKVARQNNITVSEEEVDQQIEILKSQNRLGTDNQVFEDVLQDYWGWSIADFRRSIKAELFANKVSRELDTETRSEAEAALAELDAGKKFADVAKKYSEDETTKANGGELGFEVKKTDRNIPVQTVNALFAQKPGEYSEIINIGYGLEIVKTISIEDGKVTGARIFFAYKDIDEFLNDIKAEQPTTSYIKVEQ
jgi:hypothetical protein